MQTSNNQNCFIAACRNGITGKLDIIFKSSAREDSLSINRSKCCGLFFLMIGVKIWDELKNRFGSISFISTASSADEGFINDVEVSDDMNGFGIIDEDDPT